MSKITIGIAVTALFAFSVAPVAAEDVLITQYKADPSGAPYGVAIEQGFFKKAGIDITGVISGAGGGTSVRGRLPLQGENTPKP